MYKNIATFNEAGEVQVFKSVGIDCVDNLETDMLVSEYVPDVMECTYDENTGEFKDKDGKVKYVDDKKPKKPKKR